jgi:hypothetical protein
MKRRGVTLIEAVLYISIALALIVGGLVFYQQASRAQKTNAAIRLTSAIVAEARATYASNPFTAAFGGDLTAIFGSSIGDTLVATGAVPTEYAVPSTVLSGQHASMTNPWGGGLQAYGMTMNGDPYIALVLENVPVEACPRLIASDVAPTSPDSTTATSAIADGMRIVGVWHKVTGPNGNPFWFDRNYSMSQAAEMCSVGTRRYLTFMDPDSPTGGYTGPPVAKPPSVGMYMMFRLY